MVVPDLVILTILSFYYYVLFEPEDCSEYLELSGRNNNTITKIGNNRSFTNSVYANQWIPSHTNEIIQWKVKNNKQVITQSLLIGIINNNHHHNIDNDIDAEGCYLYVGDGQLNQDGVDTDKEGPPLKQGYTAILTLDLRLKQIRFRVLSDNIYNNSDEHILFENIPIGSDIKYKLAIGMFCVMDSLTVCKIDQDSHY